MSYHPHLCNCGHQSVLRPGSTCEHCMGWIPEQESGSEAESWFDLAYFEALESQQAHTTFAA